MSAEQGFDQARAAELLRAAEDAGVRLRRRPGVSGTVGITVAAGKKVIGQVHLDWEDGRIVAAHEGPAHEPTVMFTVTPADGHALVEGEVAPSVAFMQGRLKTSGDNGLVLGVLGACAGPPLDAWIAAVRTRQDRS